MHAAKVIDLAAYRQQHVTRQPVTPSHPFSYVYFAYWTYVPVVIVPVFA